MFGDFDEDEDPDFEPEFEAFDDTEPCADCRAFGDWLDVCGVCGVTMCFGCFEMGCGVCKGPHK
jgi:hypothetical protein